MVAQSEAASWRLQVKLKATKECSLSPVRRERVYFSFTWEHLHKSSEHNAGEGREACEKIGGGYRAFPFPRFVLHHSWEMERFRPEITVWELTRWSVPFWGFLTGIDFLRLDFESKAEISRGNLFNCWRYLRVIPGGYMTNWPRNCCGFACLWVVELNMLRSIYSVCFFFYSQSWFMIAKYLVLFVSMHTQYCRLYGGVIQRG